MADHLKKHRFKPGQSGNPNGRKPVPPEVRKARALNANEVTLLITKLFRMTALELQDLMRNPKSTTLELVVGKIVAEAIKHGDYSRVNTLWDRSIGKAVDRVQHQVRPFIYEDDLGKITLGVSGGDDESDS